MDEDNGVIRMGEDAPDVYTDDMVATARPLPATVGAINLAAELENMKAVQEIMRALVPATIRATRPADWIAMGHVDDPDTKVYLQGQGLDRVTAFWGVVVGEAKATREDYEDGTFAYTFEGPMRSNRTGVTYFNVVGGRWSGDPFFRKTELRQTGATDANGKPIMVKTELPVDPLEVKKAAYQNWLGRGIGMLTGMRGWTVGDLKAAGIVGIKGISFGQGAKGGKGTQAALRAPEKFGPDEARGKLLTEITGAALAWYESMAVKAIADPAKAQYRPMEETRLVAYRAEIEARKLAAAHTTNETPKPKPNREPGEGE